MREFLAQLLRTGELDTDRLRRLRRSHNRWSEVPYGKRVQTLHQHAGQPLPVGTIGHVLSEEEHGITRHAGYAEMTPGFPGIRGVHVLVSFGEKQPQIFSLHDLAPA